MHASHSNVVSLFLPAPEQTSLIEARRRGLEKDRHSLTELSGYLQALRRELMMATEHFEAATRAGGKTPASRPRDFVQQVEALEASINRLIGAMTAHQPR
ncbi:hypothetical protein [Methylobacterium segetis]|uniref:hypothetical protein n=1 Tax=Methylobacterium segetis TaxID=2488750 RepID=UPI00105018C3|nr:hypothetical protein [Methylobacterium segetis]